jgi:Uncharacterized conserved protein
MEQMRLFRRRYLPDEMIELRDDEILSASREIIVTKWNVLKPRNDIARGYSAYFLNQGVKLSKVYGSAGNLVYWYCDIIKPDIDQTAGTYTFHDLLIDVLIYPDGMVKVIDLDEFADIMEQGILDSADCLAALRSTDALLKKIYDGEEFTRMKRYIEDLED